MRIGNLNLETYSEGVQVYSFLESISPPWEFTVNLDVLLFRTLRHILEGYIRWVPLSRSVRNKRTSRFIVDNSLHLWITLGILFTKGQQPLFLHLPFRRHDRRTAQSNLETGPL